MAFTVVVAQQKVRGVVRDNETNQPIPSAVIIYNNLKIVTNQYGVFEFVQLPNMAKIEVASNGYLSKEVLLTGKAEVVLVFLEPSNILMNEVQVIGLSTQRKTLNSPGSIGTITPRDFDRHNGVLLQNTLNLLAGVRMERRTATGGTRIVMRGYGNQTNNNGIGYKAYLNDIPLTDADGSTTLDDIDFDNLGRVEVFKGPSSSIYGTGIGGVITMFNQKAPNGTTLLQSYLTGSDGLRRTNTTFGVGTDKTNLLINYGHQALDGFRMHHRSVKDFLSINADIYNDERRSFFVYASYTKTNDLLAGQLDSLNFLNYPDSADADYIKNNAFVRIESARISLAQEYKLSDNFSNRTSVFVTTQTVNNPLANTLTKINKNKFGARTAFTLSTHFGAKPARLSFGGEVFKNVNYQKIYAQTAGVLGALTSDYELKPLMLTTFAQLELQIDDKTTVTGGVSSNYIEYDITDMRAATNTYKNNTGKKAFRPLVTPRVVLAHKFSENNLTYISYGDGYSPPNFNQVLITQLGRINEGVQPERGGNFELGTKGNAFKKSLTYELSFFTVEIADKLVAQSFAPANGLPFYTITTNAGTVRNNGFEVAINYALIPKKGIISLFRPFLTYSYYDCKNGEYKSDNNNNIFTRDYSGLKVTGVAPNLLNIGFDVETKHGVYFNATNMFTDRMPITLDNSSYSPRYNLLNTKLGWRNMGAGIKPQKWGFDLYAGLDNILGQRNSQFTFLNVTAPTGQLPKVYNPGSPYATYYMGVSLRYLFK
jgi:iron complex outermembrane receptor protein